MLCFKARGCALRNARYRGLIRPNPTEQELISNSVTLARVIRSHAVLELRISPKDAMDAVANLDASPS
ncbi:hypothetical protein GCM10007887_37630 [Methylobacterium haplocladii]|uniref:Uncharacterized protein n=1 Tax=Methylobacterium haplocladii TaxID=1176176 RepID=A0A512IVV0_9HYPH|nr:hypothetical protein MHA02_42340 [Methylobacterium haplocladii]GLS61069.1 hypothetical protein GCM10007887_37630 [Methylobacterium haplocladii]